MPSRRSVLRAVAVGSVPLAGCTDLSSSSEPDVSRTSPRSATSETPSASTETTPDASTEEPLAPTCDTPWNEDALWSIDGMADVGAPTATGCRYGTIDRRAAPDIGGGRLYASFDDGREGLAAFGLPDDS